MFEVKICSDNAKSNHTVCQITYVYAAISATFFYIALMGCCQSVSQ